MQILSAVCIRQPRQRLRVSMDVFHARRHPVLLLLCSSILNSPARPAFRTLSPKVGLMYIQLMVLGTVMFSKAMWAVVDVFSPRPPASAPQQQERQEEDSAPTAIVEASQPPTSMNPYCPPMLSRCAFFVTQTALVCVVSLAPNGNVLRNVAWCSNREFHLCHLSFEVAAGGRGRRIGRYNVSWGHDDGVTMKFSHLSFIICDFVSWTKKRTKSGDDRSEDSLGIMVHIGEKPPGERWRAAVGTILREQTGGGHSPRGVNNGRFLFCIGPHSLVLFGTFCEMVLLHRSVGPHVLGNIEPPEVFVRYLSFFTCKGSEGILPSPRLCSVHMAQVQSGTTRGNRCRWRVPGRICSSDSSRGGSFRW